MSSHYDDPDFFYDKYWQARDYEHSSEEIAIRSLIANQHFSKIADIGGGFGRLSKFLTPFSKKVVLVEPSQKQLNIAKEYLSGYLTLVDLQKGTAEKTCLPSSSVDMAIMVRVMHHLPDPMPAFAEISRILKPDGIFILEFANSTHFKAKIKAVLSGQPILLSPIERRSAANIRKQTIPFVNHHPSTLFKQLYKAGFTPIRTLSVSNFRSPFLKKFLPRPILLRLESCLQPMLSRFYFGPSIFILLRKSSS